MKVNLAQLAAWIERDGWTCVAYGADGSRRYAGPDPWDGTVTVPADALDDLDARRDRVFATLRRRAAR